MKNTKIFIYFLFMCAFANSTASRGNVANDEEIQGSIVMVERTIDVNFEDCEKNWRGLSCRVRTDQDDLYAEKLFAEKKEIRFNVGSFESLVVAFAPAVNGYSVSVFPGLSMGRTPDTSNKPFVIFRQILRYGG